MTCKEKLMEQRPEIYNYAVRDDCPHNFGLHIQPDDCCEDYCAECWEREAIDIDNDAKEKIPTSAPNYEAMYNETLNKLEEVEAKLSDLNRRYEIRERERSYYRGVTDALELVYGRKLGLMQSGGTE